MVRSARAVHSLASEVKQDHFSDSKFGDKATKFLVAPRVQWLIFTAIWLISSLHQNMSLGQSVRMFPERFN